MRHEGTSKLRGDDMKKQRAKIQWEDREATILKMLKEAGVMEAALLEIEEKQRQVLQYCRECLVQITSDNMVVPIGWPKELLGGFISKLREAIDRGSTYSALEALEKLQERLKSLAEFRNITY